MTVLTLLGDAAEQKPNPKRSAPTHVVANKEERIALAATASEFTADPRLDPDSYCVQAKILARRVPARLTEALQHFAEVGNAAGICVIRGLDVCKVPLTPLDNRGGIGMGTVFAAQVAILAHVLGEMIKYEAEGNGFLFQDMVPNPELRNTQQSQGSKVELEAHTEQCFSPLRPDYVVLGCLRGDPAAKTYSFTAEQLLARLTPPEAAMLRRPLWTTTVDQSFQPFVANPNELRGPFAIVDGPLDDPGILIDQELMAGRTLSAQRLLAKAIKVYIAHRQSHVLQPGDVLLLDNRRAMHGRSSFEPRFDGGDRFIVRGFVVRDTGRFTPALAQDRRTVLAEYS